MSELSKIPHFESMESANGYVEAVREHYRNGDGEYRGRRNQEQQIIAEITSDEAQRIVDGSILGLLSIAGNTSLPQDYEQTEIGNHTWNDFRSEFGRLLVGFAVLTNRLERDGYDVFGYANLHEQDRMKAASVLLSDYMAHNALRFGVDTSGVMRSKRVPNDDGGMDVVFYDIDKAKHQREIERNLADKSFCSGPATHPAGKLSPSMYKQLRKEFPEVDKDKFDYIIGFYSDAAEALRNLNQ